MSELPPEALQDCFRPPDVPTRVGCIHCGNAYDSSLIEWRTDPSPESPCDGFWCCPVPGCGGMGFLFDIFPTDPDWVNPRSGEKVAFFDDEDDGEEYDEEEFGDDDDELDELDEIEADPQPVASFLDDCKIEEAAIPLDDLLPDSTDPDVMKLADYDFTFIQHQLEAELSRPDQPPSEESPGESATDFRSPGRLPPVQEDDIPF